MVGCAFLVQGCNYGYIFGINRKCNISTRNIQIIGNNSKNPG